ncbi:hypothetical protein [Nocardioides mangrovi]|uniref:Uncharacterized protein n=1 Tax=Nocardioides mangrovi TaxID=2874580 RepID=A0ABS7UGR9_9ACTN|nr:hypothetical protein [Nocardioides mangrovi]MBZ5740077.1 hypothetical protein [Nocardioides mangrovi]
MQLTRVDDLDAEVDALAARHGGRAGLTAVLGGLDRRLRRTWAPCLTPHRAWTWEAVDRGDRRWWPQGVAAAPGGRYVAVSWYSTDHRSRISFADLRRRRYRHVELVLPSADGHAPLPVHAGGIAWSGSTLHVAATRAGLWVCDTRDVVRTEAGYLLPVRHRLAPSDDFRFSFLGSVGDGLVAGEYGGRTQTHRVAHIGTDAFAEVTEVVDLGVVRAQGVAIADGTYYLTASHGTRTPGSLWMGRAGALRERRYAVPMGPEDLAHDPTTDRLWTVTEHPHRRWIVTIRRRWL